MHFNLRLKIVKMLKMETYCQTLSLMNAQISGNGKLVDIYLCLLCLLVRSEFSNV